MSYATRVTDEIGKRIARRSTLLKFGIETVVVALFALATAATASANVITFSVIGTFGNAAAFLSGSTVTIDTTLGITTASNLMISAGNNPSPPNTFTGADVTQNGSFGQPFIWDHADGTELDFFMPVPPDFVGFTGGTIGLVAYFGPWGYSNGSTDTVLTALHVPEPTMISLIAIGLTMLMAIRFTLVRGQA